MPVLKPLLAADLAKGVYGLIDSKNSLDKNRTVLWGAFREVLSTSNQRLLNGVSGLGFVKARTVFGFAATGIRHYQGHAFIVLRGTELGGDKLTDINTGTSRSSTGWSVHDGFNETFQSLKNDLDPFVKQIQQQNISSVHCIGHSLGGALATLVAEGGDALSTLCVHLWCAADWLISVCKSPHTEDLAGKIISVLSPHGYRPLGTILAVCACTATRCQCPRLFFAQPRGGSYTCLAQNDSVHQVHRN